MQVEVEKLIAASPDRVFAVMFDIAGWPRVMPAITKVEILTPGQVGPGTRFRETRLMFGREAVEEMTVAELARPGRFVLTAENHGTAYRATHLLEPVQGGAATRLRLVFEGRPLTLAARVMAPLGLVMKGHVRRQLEADLAALAVAIERAGV